MCIVMYFLKCCGLVGGMVVGWCYLWFLWIGGSV